MLDRSGSVLCQGGFLLVEAASLICGIRVTTQIRNLLLKQTETQYINEGH